MMKLLLLDPPFKSFTGFFSFYFPLGLAYLAGSVKKAGFPCRILDMDAAEAKAGTMDFSHEYERYQYYIRALNDSRHPTWELMRTLILQEKPDVIGITAMTTKFGSVIQAARICKEILPQVPIIVGGPHASAMPDLTMEIPEVDYVLRGEADESLPDLMIALRDHGDLSAQRGLSWRRQGVVQHNPDRPFAQNLDALPLPDRSALMHPENYSSEDMGVILTSRGCPFRCSYCFHMWDRRVRFRSTESILEEMRQVHSQYRTTQFNFKDDSFTINKKHVLKLCNALAQEPYHAGWACTTRVDILDEELVQTMKQGGCNVIAVGIESGSERILRETDKDITHDQIRKAARLLNKHRVFWSGYFMVGLPDETEEDIRLTFRFLREVRPYYGGLGVYNPFPRTKLFDQGVALGLLDPKPGIEHFLRTNPKDLFFRDPKRRVVTMTADRFEAVVNEAMSVFQAHNRNPFNLVRRALARRRTYMNDVSLLFRDISKGLELAGLKFWADGHP
jgi:radical SAM superfamily enzyme YgiQ (UPF0313 family)